MKYTLIKATEKFYILDDINSCLYDKFSMNNYNLIEYNPNTLLSDQMAYKISKFSTTDYCPDLLKTDFSSTKYDSFEKSFNKEYLVNICGGYFYFQKITPSMISPRKILNFSYSKNKFSVINKGESITINNLPDAVYDKKDDILIFFKLNKITSFFKNIGELYREATDEEINTFLNQNFIKKVGNFSNKNIGIMNRKRIALLKDKYTNFNEKDKQIWLSYMKKYEPDLKKENNNTFQISSNADLTKLLLGLDEAYYIKPIEKEVYIANSSIKKGS